MHNNCDQRDGGRPFRWQFKRLRPAADYHNRYASVLHYNTNKRTYMKQMIIGAVGAVAVAFAIGTGIASDNKAAATNKGDTLLLMSGGQVVAELRVIAPVKLSVSDCKITTGGGKAVFSSGGRKDSLCGCGGRG